ncbi:hypothetical protein Glove_122g119 [Diversispora epigaea]|uniref:Uncharacterized protein n=1 Tax=Diversispora epigaea TaxID=1348612 RepID=A0A397J3J7_9GLOM|nr:hypothetical protein Glove_122g119 [Diversispora epigaea]
MLDTEVNKMKDMDDILFKLLIDQNVVDHNPEIKNPIVISKLNLTKGRQGYRLKERHVHVQEGINKKKLSFINCEELIQLIEGMRNSKLIVIKGQGFDQVEQQEKVGINIKELKLIPLIKEQATTINYFKETNFSEKILYKKCNNVKNSEARFNKAIVE